MRDLAPDIVRQRILIEGYFTVEVDQDVIGDFFTRITSRLDLRTYDAPVIFAPGGEGSANEGYGVFVPLIESGISLYVWTRPSRAGVVLGGRVVRSVRLSPHEPAVRRETEALPEPPAARVAVVDVEAEQPSRPVLRDRPLEELVPEPVPPVLPDDEELPHEHVVVVRVLTPDHVGHGLAVRCSESGLVPALLQPGAHPLLVVVQRADRFRTLVA